MWMGGFVPLGYDLKERKLLRNAEEASLIQRIYRRYLDLGCVRRLQLELKAHSIVSKKRLSPTGRMSGGVTYSRGALYSILQNRLYIGEIVHRTAVHAGQHEALISRDLWEEVQARLKTNNSARRMGTAARTPSLLAGLLYDDNGHRFTPLHCTNNGKRYRYYTSQKLIRNGPGDNDQPLRIPAHELEQLIVSRLRDFMRSANELLQRGSTPDDDASDQQKLVHGAQRLCSTLCEIRGAELRAFLFSVVTRIVVRPDGVAIGVSRPLLRRALGVPPGPGAALAPRTARTNGDEIALDVETRFKRLSGAVRMIVPPSVSTALPAVNEVLLKAVARAHQWHEMLRSGQMPSLHALAKATRLNERYVSRVLRCAFLAPDIVKAIVDGTQPRHLTLDRLMRGVPPVWADQRRRFLEG
jgi:hypothetical protein